MPSDHEDHKPGHARRTSLAVTAIVAGLALLTISVASLVDDARRDLPAASTQAGVGPPAGTTVDGAINSMRATLRRVPEDAATWARLGSAYVEQARLTADPGYYTEAERALRRSLRLQPKANGLALIGMGALANARHDFTSALEWGERAREVLPNTSEVYGVLVDAHTQLGNTDAATRVLQRMLDLKPGLPSFTRASYDLELHGRVGEARQAMQRALAAAAAPSDTVFCRYFLGELAFNSGQLEKAAEQYERGLILAPDNVSLLQGRAKVAAARGDLGQALRGYRDIVSRTPVPEYLQEYAQLLLSAGRSTEADKQFKEFARQLRLIEDSGAQEDLVASQVAADRGDTSEALRRARAEWGRRHQVGVADALAWALHLNGRDAEALPYADRAAALGERNASFAFHRGMILAGLGRTQQAVAALESALRINPYFSPLYAPQARETLTRLRSGR